MLFLFKWGYLEGNNPFHKKIPYIQTPGLQTTNSPIVKTNVARFGKKTRESSIKEVNTFHFFK